MEPPPQSSPERPGRQVTFPDGTDVSALYIGDRYTADQLSSHPHPAFGLYLDKQWKPTWDAKVIDWEDFTGAPPDKLSLFEAIFDTFSKARSGMWVEVGCECGCGRTGTVLACMAVLAGIPVFSAVTWVRTNYDECAVEGKEQEALVVDFKSWWAQQRKTV
jgi:hypothetical protein